MVGKSGKYSKKGRNKLRITYFFPLLPSPEFKDCRLRSGEILKSPFEEMKIENQISKISQSD